MAGAKKTVEEDTNPFLSLNEARERAFTNLDDEIVGLSETDDIFGTDSKPKKSKKPIVEEDEDDGDEDDNEDDVDGDDDETDGDDDDGDDDDSGYDDDGEDDVPVRKGKKENSRVRELEERLEKLREEQEENLLQAQRVQVATALSGVVTKIEKADQDLKALERRLADPNLTLPDYHKLNSAIKQVSEAKADFLHQANEMQSFLKNPPKKQSNPYRDAWIRENPAFKMDGKDKFSADTKRISAELEEEGFDINKPAHYKELTKRLKRKHADKFTAGNGRTSGAFKPKKASSVAGQGSSVSSKGAARANTKMEQMLLNNAKRAGIELTPAVRKELLANHRKLSK